LRKRGFLVFFIFPAAGILVLFFVQATLNRSVIRQKTEALVQEQLAASARILGIELEHRLEEGDSPQTAIERFAGEADIYFIALVDDAGAILGWASQFEGYLPIFGRPPAEPASWTIDSPAGTILNVVRSTKTKEGRTASLFLGYSLESLDEMLVYSRRSFLLLFAALAAVGLLIFSGIYRMHRLSLAQSEDATAEREEKERFREISGFTAGIAHEIKNPLNSLALLCEIMERKAPGELAGEAALGRAEVQKIGRILDQFSAALRPVDLRKDLVGVDELVRDAVQALEPSAAAKGVPIRWETRPGLAVRADRGLLAQALFNVVRNGLEAAETGGGGVDVRAERRKGHVLVTVEDTGPGIPAGDLERIFEPFFSTKADGLGVGLFLARKIIEAHAGRITAERRAGGGTVFRIEFTGGKE
jgi:signal transduction histidine kinase